MKFILFILLFFSVSVNSIRINSGKTLLFIHYGSKQHETLSINNIKYRETSTFTPSYFPIELNSGEYDISKNTISIDEIKDYTNYNFKSGLKNVIIYEGRDKNIDNMVFNILEDKTVVHIVSKFSAIPLTCMGVKTAVILS